MTDDEREYRRLAAELDALSDAGRGDSPEAEAIRDRMDGPWRRMGGNAALTPPPTAAVMLSPGEELTAGDWRPLPAVPYDVYRVPGVGEFAVLRGHPDAGRMLAAVVAQFPPPEARP